MSWGPLSLRTASHGIVFEGEASPAPGGGAMPLQEQVNGAGIVHLDDQAFTYLTWAHDSGDALLDYTDPAHPVVVADGAYVLTVAAGILSSVETQGRWEPTVAFNPSGQSFGAVLTLVAVGPAADPRWVLGVGTKLASGDGIDFYIILDQLTGGGPGPGVDAILLPGTLLKVS